MTTIVGIALLLPVFASSSLAERPNIIVVIADDFGWANVGYHRNASFRETQTPNINELVSQGIELDRHYAYRICSPSRSSFQSGRLPVHVNDQNTEPTSVNPDDPVGGYAGIPVNMTCIAQKLRSAGYSTHMTGKWDVGMATDKHTPTGRGYESWFGYFHHANDYWTERLSLGSTGVTDCCGNKYVDLWNTDKPAYGMNGTAYEEVLFTNHTLSVIEAHDVTKPLFLVHAFHIVHTPLQVPDEYLTNFSFIGFKGRRTYAAMVYYMDRVIGQMVNKLKTRGMWDNSLMVFTSDNGGPLYISANANNYPLKGGKYSDWEGGVRTNAFVSGGFLPKSVVGTKLESYVHIADWYATFAALAGADVHDPVAVAAGLHDVDGVNQWPLLSGQSKQAPRSEIHLSTQALIQGRYKVVVGVEPMTMWPEANFPTATDVLRQPLPPMIAHNNSALLKDYDCKSGCLYDILADPSERIDIASKQPEIFTNLTSRLTGLNKGYYNPNRGKGDPRACHAAEQYGGYYGPFIHFGARALVV